MGDGDVEAVGRAAVRQQLQLPACLGGLFERRPAMRGVSGPGALMLAWTMSGAARIGPGVLAVLGLLGTGGAAVADSYPGGGRCIPLDKVDAPSVSQDWERLAEADRRRVSDTRRRSPEIRDAHIEELIDDKTGVSKHKIGAGGVRTFESPFREQIVSSKNQNFKFCEAISKSEGEQARSTDKVQKLDWNNFSGKYNFSGIEERIFDNLEVRVYRRDARNDSRIGQVQTLACGAAEYVVGTVAQFRDSFTHVSEDDWSIDKTEELKWVGRGRPQIHLTNKVRTIYVFAKSDVLFGEKSPGSLFKHTIYSRECLRSRSSKCVVTGKGEYEIISVYTPS